MVQTSDPPGQKAAAVAEVDVRKGIAVAIFAGQGSIAFGTLSVFALKEWKDAAQRYGPGSRC